MKERIDWDAYKAEVKASIKNEELWMLGSTGECSFHEENLKNLRQGLEWLEDGNYDAVLQHYEYDEEVFRDFFK